MEKPKLVAQVYGYLVCLVSVITFLISIASLVNSVIDMGDPLHAGSSFQSEKSAHLASFEIYKADMFKTTKNETDASKNVYVPDDKTIRAMYDTAREEKISAEMHQIRRSLIVNSLLIMISIALFFTHWNWMKKQTN